VQIPPVKKFSYLVDLGGVVVWEKIEDICGDESVG
jgi:hypothetical protein